MKYHVIHFKFQDYGAIRDGWWHGYHENAEAAKAALLADPIEGKNVKEIVEVIVSGFDIGDRVVVKDHEIIDDEPGEVIAYAHDGYVIVEWKQFDYAEEFHWTELKKVIEPEPAPPFDDDLDRDLDGWEECE
jgi:signal peptidase I